MRNEFTTLYKALEKSLEDILTPATGANGGKASLMAITLVREKISELRSFSGKGFVTSKDEIEFFRYVWPVFYGKLFYFIKVHHYEVNRSKLPAEMRPSLIKREERQIIRFLHDHAEFGMYYEAGSPVIDVFFTREHSQEWVLDELSVIIDPENATVASIRAAWWLAYGEYRDFLEREEQALANPAPRKKFRCVWKETKSAAVDLIKAQAEAGSVYIDGLKATAAQLRAIWEEQFEEDLKDFDLLLYQGDNRKGDTSPYFTKLMNALTGRKARLRK